MIGIFGMQPEVMRRGGVGPQADGHSVVTNNNGMSRKDAEVRVVVEILALRTRMRGKLSCQPGISRIPS
jgi:hypothetical protein